MMMMVMMMDMSRLLLLPPHKALLPRNRHHRSLHPSRWTGSHGGRQVMSFSLSSFLYFVLVFVFVSLVGLVQMMYFLLLSSIN